MGETMCIGRSSEMEMLNRKSWAPAKLSMTAAVGVSAIVLAVTTALVLPSPASSATANKPAVGADANSAAKANADAALKAYSAGTRAYETGRSADAVQTLSTALSAGGLQPSQMAKALYYRGMAQKKLGKPALAISDLTSAIWLKGGLSDTDRANAIQARQQAHKEAGLGDVAPPVPEHQQAAAAPAPAAIASPIVAAAPAPVVASAPVPNITPPLTAAPVAAPAPVIAAADSSPVPDAASILAGSVVTTSSIPPAKMVETKPWMSPDVAPSTPTAVAAPTQPVEVAAAIPQTIAIPEKRMEAPDEAEAAVPISIAAASVGSAPVAAAPSNTPSLSAVESGEAAVPQGASPLANAGQAVTGFFGNIGKSIGLMFNNGDSATSDAGAQATQSASAQVATSSTGPSGGIGGAAVASQPQSSSWDSSTITAAGAQPAKPAAKKLAAAKPAPAAVSPKKLAAAAAPGNFKLQVAAVRSREEAERISAGVSAVPAVQGTRAAIDEANISGMGTYYRVRLGPYSDAAEPGKLCNALKPQGYDCMVVQ